jgi:hypothetical protein
MATICFVFNKKYQMNFIKKLFIKKVQDSFTEAPEGICPNCWGDQEYGNVVRDKFKDTQIDVNNHTAKNAFIQDFMVTHMDGIKLKSSIKGMECPTCRVVYKK